MPKKKISGRWMRDWRQRLGWTQDQAATALGFAHRNSVQKFESGVRTIPKTVELACRWLEATL